jgi:hypothetical protein
LMWCSRVLPFGGYAGARFAKMLGENVERLEEIAMDMEREDGCRAILAVGDVATTAFTPQGVETLKDFLKTAGREYAGSISSDRGARRMDTIDRRYRAVQPGQKRRFIPTA